MKYKIIAAALLVCLLTPRIAAEETKSDTSFGSGIFEMSGLSEYDIRIIGECVECTAGSSSFAVRISLACVILNRYYSPLYPDSVKRIIEGADFLSHTPAAEVSHRTETAVKYALFGASPCGKALYARKLAEGEEITDELSYIVIDEWVFYYE